MVIQKTEFERFFAPVILDISGLETSNKDTSANFLVYDENGSAVIHPDSKFVSVWKAVERIMAVYIFLDVPFRVAFHGFACFSVW